MLFRFSSWWSETSKCFTPCAFCIFNTNQLIQYGFFNVKFHKNRYQSYGYSVAIRMVQKHVLISTVCSHICMFHMPAVMRSANPIVWHINWHRVWIKPSIYRLDRPIQPHNMYSKLFWWKQSECMHEPLSVASFIAFIIIVVVVAVAHANVFFHYFRFIHSFVDHSMDIIKVNINS